MADSDVELAVLRLAWRLDALDQWRKETDDALHELENGLRAIVNEDEIEKAVRTAVRKERTVGLTFVQKLALTIVAGITIADGIKGLVS